MAQLEARVDGTVAKHLYLAVGASVSKLGEVASVPHTGTRFNGLIAWDDSKIKAGVEGFLARDYTSDQVTGTALEDTARGVSAFANYRFVPKVGAFARFDFIQPRADTDTGIKDYYLNGGIECSPYKFLDLALVYKHEVVDGGAAGFVFGTTNGGIGTMGANQSGTYQENRRLLAGQVLTRGAPR